jgi:hypothetical protein
MQSLNNVSVTWLNTRGFNGDQLRAFVDVKHTSVKAKLTVPHSRERIQALKNAKSHGDIFLVTGGGHCASDDFFIKNRLKVKEREVSRLKIEKKDKVEKETREAEAMKILQEEIPVDKLKKGQLEVLLIWHGISKKDHPKGNTTKQAMWGRIKESNVPPPSFQKWTEQDETLLNALKNENIDVSETALGRAETTLKLQIDASFQKMDKESRLEFIKDLEHQSTEIEIKPKEDTDNLILKKDDIIESDAKSFLSIKM